MDIPNQSPNKKERQQTDDSLTDERGKTDESFETYRDKTESETDKIVSTSRLEADKARFERRTEVDLAHESRSKKDRDELNLRLINERKLEDKAIEKERKRNDFAIDLERDEKERLLNKLVGLERKATDKNLFSERAKTDLDAEVAAKILNVEQEAHLDTKSALTTREEFVAIVSHDLRNPIGAILSSVEMLIEDTSMMALGDDTKRWIEIIKRNAETSLRLISDILDMERIVEGKLQLQIAPHQIRELVRYVVDSYGHVAAAKGIALKMLTPNFETKVNCDKDRFSQVLSNLIGNALKFTPEGGAVDVSVEEDESEITVSIIDTGPGIPEEQRNQIFEKFAQLGNKNRSGLGLGLYISKTLVESHHGKIWVTTSPGNGSKFSFTLPKAD